MEKKQESERIVFEDPHPQNGFILLPDMKWDGLIMSNLYLVAIVNVRNIKSLRDLNEEHLPLLKNIQTKGNVSVTRILIIRRGIFIIFIVTIEKKSVSKCYS